MWELDCEESWAQKNWCFWTVVLEKTLESPLDCKEIQPGSPKGNQFWIFIGRTDVEAETPILGPPHAKSRLTGKDSDAGRDWGQEEKGMTEDEMVGWHHWLNGHEFEQTLGDSEGQGSLVCCSSWDHKESDTTERLNWTEWGIEQSLLLGEAKAACKHICGCKEKEMATHSSVLAWEIPWTEKPGGLTVHGVTKSQTQLSNWAHTFYLYERLKQQANTFVDAKKKARKEKKSND